MSPTKILFHNKAREAILKGVNLCYEAVRLSLGASSGSALMYRTLGRGPRIVDDGHAILQNLEPKNEAEKLAVAAFREASERTNQLAGDGTATTGVLAGKLINEIFSKLSESSQSYASKTKSNVQKIKKELLELSKSIQAKVTEQSKKIEKLEDLEKISTVSMGNEELGKIIAKLVWEVGIDGFVDVVDGYKGEIETEVIKGARFAAKPGAKAFINNPKRFEMVIEDCPVLLTNYKLDNDNQAQKAFASVLQKNSKVCVLAPDFSEQVLLRMVQTTKQGVFMFPVKVPSLRTEQFEDLAIYFGATFINKDLGKKLENVTEADLGFVQKLVVKDTENREDAVAVGGRGSLEGETKVGSADFKVSSPVSERIKILKEQIIEERIDSHKKLLERRIASLASAVGVIRVGGSTTAESIPLKLKIEDAQYACKAALEEGYVKGGGLCLKEIAEELPESILTASLKAPYEQIQANNEEPLEIGEDIIDPTKVVRLAVEHAVSVAASLITVKLIIAEEREENPAEGYHSIADAINFYNRLVNKKESIYKEAEFEMMRDQEADWDSRIKEDNG